MSVFRRWFRVRRRIVVELPRMEFVSDARPIGHRGRGRHRGPDLEAERRRRLRRGALYLVLGSAIVAGSSAALFAERGYLDVLRSRAQRDVLREKVDRQLDRVIHLKHEVQRLESDPTALERIAREELGLSRRGEVQFLLPRDRDEAAWREGEEESDGERAEHDDDRSPLGP